MNNLRAVLRTQIPHEYFIALGEWNLSLASHVLYKNGGHEDREEHEGHDEGR